LNGVNGGSGGRWLRNDELVLKQSIMLIHGQFLNDR
jgi:hypothetical protein